jgi:hypothetical protein
MGVLRKQGPKPGSIASCGTFIASDKGDIFKDRGRTASLFLTSFT